MTFEFWTDDGDQDDIEADSLERAAESASRLIKPREWRDGAWGFVRDPESRAQIRVSDPT